MLKIRTFVSTRFSVVCWLVTTAAIQMVHDVVVTAQCTMCADGSEPDMEGLSIGSAPCSLIAESIPMTPATSDDCYETQILGYQNCNCPTYPSDQYCYICGDDDNTNERVPRSSKNKIVPGFGNGVTCETLEFTRRNSDGIACADSARAAWYCGCPSYIAAEERGGDCYLCDGASSSSSSSVVLPTFGSLRLPPEFQMTCEDLDRAGSLFFTNDNECDQLTADLPINAQAYCGCSSSDDNTFVQACSLCEGTAVLSDGDADVNVVSRSSNGSGTTTSSTTSIINPRKLVPGLRGLTCGDLATAMIFVTDLDYCTTMSQQYASACCAGAAVNTPSPTIKSDVMGSGDSADISINNNGGDLVAPTPEPTNRATVPVPGDRNDSTNRSIDASSAMVAVSTRGVIYVLIVSTIASILL